LLTARDVAAFLGLSMRTVYSLCEQGLITHLRIANAIRVELAALLEFVRVHRSASQ